MKAYFHNIRKYTYGNKCKNTFMNLAKRITAVRKEMELNKVEFGALIGVSHVAVGQYEDGSTKSLHPDVLFRMEDKTGFSARWIHQGKLPKKVADHKVLAEILEKLAQLNAEQLDVMGGLIDQMIGSKAS
jgi:transcriptional regulator with XRE-family HTH domain